MPRKTKAELAAEREALKNAEMETMEPEQEAAPLPAEEEGPEPTTASLPEKESQEVAIAGLLADYSAASMEDAGMEDSGEEMNRSPRKKAPRRKMVKQFLPQTIPYLPIASRWDHPSLPRKKNLPRRMKLPKLPLLLQSRRPRLLAEAQRNSPPRAHPFSRPTSVSWTGTSLRNRCRNGTASMPPTARNPS